MFVLQNIYIYIAHCMALKKSTINVAEKFQIRFLYLTIGLDLHDLNAYKAGIKFNDPIQNTMETK